MALPAAGGNPPQNPISARQIGNEFGYTHPNDELRLGSYRTTNGQGNFPVSFGALQFNSIDAQTGGTVPTSGQIKFSDFYSTKLQQVVNFYGSGRGGNRLVAKDRYDAGGSNDVNVVGNYRTRPTNSSGTKVHVHVNQTIGSEKTRVEHCALRTGSWDSSTTLQVDVGGSGRIGGAGGDGGDGGTPFSPGDGTSGTSGLGIQYNPTTVNVASGGVITAGFGGGGGGGGAYDTDKEATRTASGGGGGGGAGIPAGEGGAAGTGSSHNTNGGPGNDGNISEGGAGGGDASNDGEAVSAGGGAGGEASQSAQEGGTGTGGEGSTYAGGDPGAAGAAIRRNTGFTVNVTNNGSINGVQNATTVL